MTFQLWVVKAKIKNFYTINKTQILIVWKALTFCVVLVVNIIESLSWKLQDSTEMCSQNCAEKVNFRGVLWSTLRIDGLLENSWFVKHLVEVGLWKTCRLFSFHSLSGSVSICNFALFSENSFSHNWMTLSHRQLQHHSLCDPSIQ